MFVPVCTSAISDYDLGEICGIALYSDGEWLHYLMKITCVPLHE